MKLQLAAAGDVGHEIKTDLAADLGMQAHPLRIALPIEEACEYAVNCLPTENHDPSVGIAGQKLQHSVRTVQQQRGIAAVASPPPIAAASRN